MPARRRPRNFAPAMMVGAVLLLAAVPARAQDAHGAIAFAHIAQDLAVAYGLAWDYPSRDEAQEAAMNACLNGGGSDCTVLAWFQNACGALAVDQYGMAQGKGARSLEQAEARSLRTCEAAGGVGCAVVGSQCVSPDGQPDTWSGSETVLAPPEEESAPTGGTADRDPPATDTPQDEGLTREERMRVQKGLAALGFDAGPADGMFGPRTRSAIWDWQQAKGLETTGYLSREEAEVLATAGAGFQEQPASRETAEPAGSRNQVLYFAAAGPKCAELGSNLGERDGCWEEIPSQPGCFVWTTSYPGSRIEEWTGGCSGDTAHGRGSWSSVSVRSGNTVTGTGALMHGKRNGHWVLRWASGTVQEGPYVDGKPHGHWVNRYVNGIVIEGPWVHGERHGHWAIRWAEGSVLELEWRNGSREGQSGVYQTADGSRHPGEWSDGCFRDASGVVWVWGDGKTKEECKAPEVMSAHAETPPSLVCANNVRLENCWVRMVNHENCWAWSSNSYQDSARWDGECVGGKAHGEGRYGAGSAIAGSGSYAYGKRVGDWYLTIGEDQASGPYVDGRRHGDWVETDQFGNTFRGPYVDGKRHGDWVEEYDSGAIHEGPYIDGKRHGDWVEEYDSGAIHEGPYIDGRKHGLWVKRDPMYHRYIIEVNAEYRRGRLVSETSICHPAGSFNVVRPLSCGRSR